MQKIIVSNLHHEEIFLRDALDLPNPHAIIAKNSADIVGLVCRVSFSMNSWVIRWNTGHVTDHYPTVEMLISIFSKDRVSFYLHKF